ncbi:DUF423 domain-containing protein [Solemya velum gill symbiont]|uniref:DUF423 domain-containing protein n=1 Tax=Solemya velum gill symbiont TaxID=2340 RepID=A0A0B0H9T1_SOVGS|nr:DUF423 domain-containing protein [Solemya velum gill symbiont]KHF25387.1 hypothetical protein JV46_11030 [Solemya velum gill symbiont]OOY34313.1 hypothetical protein BOV88_10530 [Solemya velum gill symbiont]OOY36963.1 hypothetical protein BOV89_09690 [Solemya velum gill symbiont]OOY40664.1 hypothetical protein BOV90_02920 [Solemya velum gill symbiont]OOY44456.1 hypothetical protein BOV91_01310 [Solemya velum gill symbiont]
MNRHARQLISLGAINGFLAVALGAFGAHGLKTIASVKQLAWFKTGTDYHMVHALAILLCAAIAMQLDNRSLVRISYLFQAGILIFCGTLYLMALGAPTWLGAITPIGGTALLVAWAWLAWSMIKVRGEK